MDQKVKLSTTPQAYQIQYQLQNVHEGTVRLALQLQHVLDIDVASFVHGGDKGEGKCRKMQHATLMEES